MCTRSRSSRYERAVSSRRRLSRPTRAATGTRSSSRPSTHWGGVPPSTPTPSTSRNGDGRRKPALPVHQNATEEPDVSRRSVTLAGVSAPQPSADPSCPANRAATDPHASPLTATPPTTDARADRHASPRASAASPPPPTPHAAPEPAPARPCTAMPARRPRAAPPLRFAELAAGAVRAVEPELRPVVQLRIVDSIRLPAGSERAAHPRAVVGAWRSAVNATAGQLLLSSRLGERSTAARDSTTAAGFVRSRFVADVEPGGRSTALAPGG